MDLTDATTPDDRNTNRGRGGRCGLHHGDARAVRGGGGRRGDGAIPRVNERGSRRRRNLDGRQEGRSESWDNHDELLIGNEADGLKAENFAVERKLRFGQEPAVLEKGK